MTAARWAVGAAMTGRMPEAVVPPEAYPSHSPEAAKTDSLPSTTTVPVAIAPEPGSR